LPLPDIIQRCCFVERDILAGSGDTSEEIAGFMSGYVVLPDVFSRWERDLPGTPAGPLS
jgi:hypothetical protein